MTRSRSVHGFTLLELVVVVTVIALLASILIPKTENLRDDAYDVAAKTVLQAVRQALGGSSVGAGYIDDMRTIPGFQLENVRIHDLLTNSAYPTYDKYDPVLRRGWRGPYLLNVQILTLSAEGDPKEYGAADPWGHPIILQIPPASAFAPPGSPAQRFAYARLVSTGPDGILSTPTEKLAGMQADGTSEVRGDDLVLFLSRNDLYEP